jgi:hypothetical protein
MQLQLSFFQNNQIGKITAFMLSVNNAVLSAFASKDCSLRLRTTGPTIIQKKKDESQNRLVQQWFETRKPKNR